MYSPEAKIINFLGTKIFWILLLTLIVLIFWFPTRNIPYWWDSAGYVVHAARYYINTNFTSLLLPSDSGISAFARPPLFVFSLAIIWKIFGESLLTSHLFYLIFVLLAVFFTYLLGKKIANFENEFTGHLVGFFAALFLLFTPVFLAQVGIIYPEIPVTAFAVMTIYYFLDKKTRLYLLSASLMLLTKETSAIVVFVILVAILIQFLIEFFKKQKGIFKKTLKELAIYGSPILILIGWFIWHKIATGWMFVMPYYQGGMIERAFSLAKIVYSFKFFFLEQFRFLVTFFILGSFLFCIFNKEKRQIIKRFDILSVALMTVAVVFLFGIVDFLPRYIIFGLPFLYLCFFYCSALLFFERPFKEQISIFGAITLILLLFFSFGWNDHQEIRDWRFPPLEENLEYLDVIAVGKEMAGFIEKYYPKAVVWTGFPSDYMLSEPFQHYVSKPIEVHNCKDYKEGDKVDLLVFHLLSPPQMDCLRMIQELRLSLLIPFGKNGKWMQIYKNPNL